MVQQFLGRWHFLYLSFFLIEVKTRKWFKMENKEVFIKKVFNSIADDYDVMNLVLTVGFFSLGKTAFLRL